MAIQKKVIDMMPYDSNIQNSGHLDVGDGHRLYWEDWGNPEAESAIIHLHGGPGGNFSDSHKGLYDPCKHRVLFHDQRGCGKSLPFGRTECNTSQGLIADIERLRQYSGKEKVFVAGGSWGSTLALLYALSHPERVAGLLLWSVFLARQSEVDWVNEGRPRVHMPEEWERFISLVPEEQRGDGPSIMAFYAKKMRGENKAEAKRHALEWSRWEMSLCSIHYDPKVLGAELEADPGGVERALIQIHYLEHGCFIPKNYILANIHTIQAIPCHVAHGRFDHCTPGIAAYDLQKAYGDKLQLTWVNSGHLRSDPLMLQTLRGLVGKHL